jgi:hypothetical protein
MLAPQVRRIESEIEQLSTADQLWLIERLAYLIRQKSPAAVKMNDNDWNELASDLEIQSELKVIAREFASAEQDGLERI